jgi:hypothetical protein
MDLDFSSVDPIIMPWAANEGLIWFTQYRDGMIRMLKIQKENEQDFFIQIISVQDSNVIVHLSLTSPINFLGKKVVQIPLPKLENYLSDLLHRYEDDAFFIDFDPNYYVAPKWWDKITTLFSRRSYAPNN